MRMQILLLAFFPVAHITIPVERNSHLERCRQQGMKPCQQQMNLCISDAEACPQRPAHPLSGLHQLAPALLADYRQSKPRVTLNYSPGMLPAAKSCSEHCYTLGKCVTLCCTSIGWLPITDRFTHITDGQQQSFGTCCSVHVHSRLK